MLNIAVILVCSAAVAFLLRVLTAWLKEGMSLNPGDPFKAWDISGTYDYMPSQYITFRWEFNHRHANVPYWSGPGVITPPWGNNTDPGAVTTGWQPDLRKTEDRATMAILVKF